MDNEQIAAFLVSMDDEAMEITNDGDLYALRMEGELIGRFSSPKVAVQYVVSVLRSTAEDYDE